MLALDRKSYISFVIPMFNDSFNTFILTYVKVHKYLTPFKTYKNLIIHFPHHSHKHRSWDMGYFLIMFPWLTYFTCLTLQICFYPNTRVPQIHHWQYPPQRLSKWPATDGLITVSSSGAVRTVTASEASYKSGDHRCHKSLLYSISHKIPTIHIHDSTLKMNTNYLPWLYVVSSYCCCKVTVFSHFQMFFISCRITKKVEKNKGSVNTSPL